MSRGSDYSEAYKREAVAKAKNSGNVSQTARELGITNKTLHAWINRYSETVSINEETASTKDLTARIRQLERQLEVREKQIEVLKKAISIVSQNDPSGT